MEISQQQILVKLTEETDLDMESKYETMVMSLMEMDAAVTEQLLRPVSFVQVALLLLQISESQYEVMG